MTQPVIDLDRVSVSYHMYARPIDQLKELVFGGVRHETFHAVRDVSITVREGERLGIVGPNGAGKSTLLKVIAGTMQASSGRVVTHGRISSLLSLVPAWNAEDTGIENIRFNLLLNGVSEKQIPSLIDDIAEFTELGPFLFHPVKTYSTGMGARLSFGIATAAEPDILIIDEVLGTGDGYFAWKAMKRMEAFCARGRAMIFVSHSTDAVQKMCDRVVWMQGGGIRRDGPARQVLAEYELDFRRAEDEALRAGHGGRGIQDDLAIGEVTDSRHVRLRIVPVTHAPFFSTHFLRDIGVRFAGGTWRDAPLELAAVSDEAPLALDVLNSEWGRPHEKDGHLCRTMSRLPGRNAGGQIVARLPEAQASSIEARFTVCSLDPREELQVERLDMASGLWRPLETVSRSMRGSWRTLAFQGGIGGIDDANLENTIERLTEAARPDAEILSVKVMAGAEEAVSITERQPFELHIRVGFNRPPKLADIGVKVTRMDGTYVFWQSSGQVGANLSNPQGEKLVRFVFDPNIFSAAEYFINVHVTDGWNFPDNYPHSRVFARQMNAARFRIVPELPGVDFGAVNQRVEVKVETVERADVIA